jgi:hypothetical protein
MIEQAIQLKKRYDKMVRGFTEDNFKAWFTEFFKLYPFITMIQWRQYTPYAYDGKLPMFGIDDPELELSAAYVQAHPELSVVSPVYHIDEYAPAPSDRFVTTYRSDLRNIPDLVDAVKSIKALFEAEDILQHVFGDPTQIRATPDTLVREECLEHD